MNITLRQLRLFFAVAREMSFTGAAARVNLTQSALTAAIRALEGELGVKLFARTTRSVRLTGEGRQFLAVTERLLADIDASFDNMKAIAARTKGHVTVAAAASFMQYVVCPAVARLAALHPGISVRMLEQTSDAAASAVVAGEVDFAISSLIRRHALVEGVTLLRDRFCVVASPAAGIVRSRVMRWRRLDPSQYVGLNPSNGIRQIIDQAADLPEDLRRPRYEVGSASSLEPMLSQGFGFGIVPALTAAPMVEHGLLAAVLEEPRLHRELRIVRRKGHSPSPSAQALLEQLAKGLAALTPTANVALLMNAETLNRLAG